MHGLQARRSNIIINHSHFNRVSRHYFFSSTLPSSFLPRSFRSPPIFSSNTFKSHRHPLFLFSAAPTFLHLFNCLVQSIQSLCGVQFLHATPCRPSISALDFPRCLQFQHKTTCRSSLSPTKLGESHSSRLCRFSGIP